MDLADLKFFNPWGDIVTSENRLPHWQQEGATYFVTFHLADSIPAHLRARWEEEREAWLRWHPEPWTPEIEREYHERFSGAIEEWLDAGHGACVLRQPECAGEAAAALRFFDGVRVAMLSFIVMPNHVHALFVLNGGWTLEKMLQSWKRHSSRQIHLWLGQEGTLWQKDYFDRLIRDAGHFANCVRYIRRNPAKARLGIGEYVLYESEMVKAIE